MPRNPELQLLKEQKITERYKVLCKQHPQWRNEAILEKLAVEFFLSGRTVYAIVSGEYARRREKATVKN